VTEAAEVEVDQPQGTVRVGVGGYAFLVASGIFLSRVAGLIRQRIIAHFFGNSPALGAFWAAFRIPNFLQNLAGEQVLSASFIPIYARLLAEGKRELADRVAGVVGALLALTIAALVLLGVLLSPMLVDLLAPGFEGEVRELTIDLVRILFPGAGMLVMSAWCLGILNSHRRFFLSYVAPVLWNGAMIAALLLFGFRQERPALAVTLAWGAVVGSALQFGIQLPFVLRYARDLRLGLDLSLDPVRQVLRNFGPVLISRGVVQISAFIDEIIASFLGTAAMAGLSYAQTLYLLPISLFGMSVAAAELPEMSSALGTTEEVSAKLRQRVRAGLRQIAFLIVPSVVAIMAIGAHLVAALYQTGRFGPNDTLFVWYILLGYALGLFPVTLARLYSSAFYALRDTRTPLRFALVRVVIGATLGYVLAFPLRPYLIALLRDVGGFTIPQIDDAPAALGVVGLSLAAGLGSWIEFTLLRAALARRIGPSDAPAEFQWKVWSMALAAGAVALLAAAFLPPLHPILSAVLVAGVFGVIYLGGTTALHVQESSRILNILRRRR
jgi:putative peptidoglycan lipid II flippase